MHKTKEEIIFICILSKLIQSCLNTGYVENTIFFWICHYLNAGNSCNWLIKCAFCVACVLQHCRHFGLLFLSGARPSHFQITFFLVEGLDWNFRQMFISICVMDTQKGDNPKKYIRVIAPFSVKNNLPNNFFSTQRIGLKLRTNVYTCALPVTHHFESSILSLICASYFLSYCPLLFFILHSYPDHNSKTIWAINLKLHRWIYLIDEKCSAQEQLLCASYFRSYCPLLFFILHSCLDHNSYTIRAINLKLHNWC